MRRLLYWAREIAWLRVIAVVLGVAALAIIFVAALLGWPLGWYGFGIALALLGVIVALVS